MTRDLECRLKDVLWGVKLLRRFIINASRKPYAKINRNKNAT